MNRQIRFRAFDENHKAMHYSENCSLDWLFGLPERHGGAIMQFTGLHDSTKWEDLTGLEQRRWIEEGKAAHEWKGRPIYEGDVVKWDDKSKGKYWRVCEVIWKKSRYELHGYTFYSAKPEEKVPVDFKFGAFIYEEDGQLKVIGNRFENPELLKQ